MWKEILERAFGLPELIATVAMVVSVIIYAAVYWFKGAKTNEDDLQKMWEDEKRKTFLYYNPSNAPQFIRYARNGETEKLQEMLNTGSVNINQTDSNGNTALIAAAWNGKTQTVLFLLKSGADAYLRNESLTDAANAACNNDKLETFAAMLEYGLDASKMSFGGKLLVMYLSGKNRTDLLESVLKQCGGVADPSSALWSSCNSLEKKNLAMLLSYKADPNAANELGETPLMALASALPETDGQKQIQKEMAVMLLENGADTSRKDSEGLSAEDIAKQYHADPAFIQLIKLRRASEEWVRTR